MQLLWVRMLRGLLLNAEQEWPSEAKRYGGEDEGVDQYISKVHEWKNATQTRTRFHCDDFLLYTRYQYLMAIQHTNTDNHLIAQANRSPVSVHDLNLSITLLLFGDVIF